MAIMCGGVPGLCWLGHILNIPDTCCNVQLPHCSDVIYLPNLTALGVPTPCYLHWHYLKWYRESWLLGGTQNLAPPVAVAAASVLPTVAARSRDASLPSLCRGLIQWQASRGGEVVHS